MGFQCASDFALRRDDERLAILSREHRVGCLVVDESLLVRIELQPGPQCQAGFLDIDTVGDQMLSRSLERVLIVVEQFARLKLGDDLRRPFPRTSASRSGSCAV